MLDHARQGRGAPLLLAHEIGSRSRPAQPALDRLAALPHVIAYAWQRGELDAPGALPAGAR